MLLKKLLFVGKLNHMIAIKNISYYYPSKKSKYEDIILNDLSFEIKKGEFVSILGRSGCGKTTLANILAGYIKPINGEILINDSAVNKPGKNRILVNQENDLFEWMTVIDNIAIVTNNTLMINNYLKLVDLKGHKNKYPNSLSAGMKKKLSLARALSVNPDFLILDEPFSSLDYHTKQSLHMELDKLFSLTKKTTLLVTHDLEEAIFLSDRIIVLGGKPASIKNEINLEFPHPRKLDIKDTKQFNSIRHKIKKSY